MSAPTVGDKDNILYCRENAIRDEGKCLYFALFIICVLMFCFIVSLLISILSREKKTVNSGCNAFV